MELISKIFTDVNILHKYSNEEYLIKISVKELLQKNVVNWKYNRPHDEIRCNEIKDYFIKPNALINSPLHLHYNERYEEFECLDGIHRYTALKLIEDKQLVNDKTAIIFIYFKKTEGELIDIFKNINKSIAVPELYISNEYSENDKEVIQTVVNEWKDKYEPHFSSSKDFRVPQMNRDIFIDFVTDIYNDYKIRSKSRLLQLLNKTNDSVKEYIDTGYSHNRKPIKFTPKQLDKCKKTGCYLFLYKDSILKEYFIPLSNEKIKNIN